MLAEGLGSREPFAPESTHGWLHNLTINCGGMIDLRLVSSDGRVRVTLDSAELFCNFGSPATLR